MPDTLQLPDRLIVASGTEEPSHVYQLTPARQFYLTDCGRGFAVNVLDDFLQAAVNDGLPFVMVWCPQRETIH